LFFVIWAPGRRITRLTWPLVSVGSYKISSGTSVFNSCTFTIMGLCFTVSIHIEERSTGGAAGFSLPKKYVITGMEMRTTRIAMLRLMMRARFAALPRGTSIVEKSFVRKYGTVGANAIAGALDCSFNRLAWGSFVG